MRILIIGCGYVGQEAARLFLLEENPVTGWVRSDESAAELASELTSPIFQVYAGDAASAADWQRLLEQRFNPFDVIVHCVSSGRRSGTDAYRRAYYDTMRQAIAHAQDNARIIFVSSTSVYGQKDGEIVTEASPAEPATETGMILRETEDLVLEAGGIVLRVAGIYGPGRGYLFRKFVEGEAIIPGDGLRTINQIHRDDVAGAIHFTAAQSGTPGAIYNVVDDSPRNYLEFFGWLSESLNLPMPPHGPVDTKRKRGVTDKRVSNARLRAMGWEPRYPSFREGYREISTLATLPMAGNLSQTISPYEK